MGSHLQQSESKVMLKDLNIERQLDEDAATKIIQKSVMNNI